MYLTEQEKKIIKLHNNKISYTDIGIELGTTRNVVAGVIWRYKNPGMYKKNLSNKDRRRKHK